VYLLPLYSPLRLIEEICQLDHLSHGRLEDGVGRGLSPFELKYHKSDHDQSRDIFIDAFNCITAGLASETLTYAGTHFSYSDVPRHIFVAATEAEARRFGKPAMEHHLANLNWLRTKHGVTGPASRMNVPRGETFEDCVADGSVIAGTPERVREEIERQAAELG